MDSFLVEFVVAGRRERSGRTKDNRDWSSVEYKGKVVDSRGHSIDCAARLSFGGKESLQPRDGEHVLLHVESLDLSGMFGDLRFTDVEPLSKSKQ